MFFFSFLCKKNNVNDNKVEAFILVDYADLQGAEFIAAKYVEQTGYMIVKKNEAAAVGNSDDIESSYMKKLYVDAQKNGVAAYLIGESLVVDDIINENFNSGAGKENNYRDV